jgi:site-specific recombinase XerD
MQNLVVTTAKNELSTYAPEAINEGAKKLLLNSKSLNTKLAYKKQVSYFCMWCKNEGINFAVTYSDTDITVTGLDDLKPTHIANYVSHLVSTGKTSSTIVCTIAAINSVTVPFDYAPAKTHLVKTVVEGAKRTIGVAPKKAKAVQPTEIILNLHTIQKHYPNEATQLRNTALLLLGFAGAFRRSELVSLKVSDFQLVDTNTATFYIAKSKVDQTGKGDVKPVKRSSVKQACAINAVQKWITFAGLGKDDFLFPSIHKSGKVQTKPLSGKDVSLIVKTILGTDFSAHSLRSGFITEAFNKGVNVKVIQQTTLQITDAVTNSYNRVEKLTSAIDIFG